MVFINLLASSLLLLGMLFYAYIFPRKKINLFLLLLLVLILPLLSLLRKGDYESGDFNIHIYRIMVFYEAIMEGHLMPSWAGELNATYGNPLFIFNYSLPYYFISFFHFIGISFISSMKIYLGLSLYLSGIFMYLWIKKLTENELAAFTSAIFYVFSPYHLIDVHFRATLGESTIFTLAPLIIYFVTAYIRDKKLVYLVSAALISQLLFLAHPMIAGIFIGISVLFTVWTINIKKDLLKVFFVIATLGIGTIGAVSSWFSFILYSSHIPQSPGGIVWQFNQLYQFLYAPWRYGFLFQGPKGELAFILGYTQIFVVILVVILLITNKITVKLKYHHLFWLSIMLTILFFMTPLSKIIWKHFPLLSMLQSNRLLLPIALCTSVIAGYLTISFSNTKKKKLFIYILIFITIAYTILNWGHRRVIPEIDDNVLRQGVWKSTVTEGLTAYFLNTKWADPNNFWFSSLPKNHLEIINGKGTVKELNRTSVRHTYVINAQTPLAIKENTLYFPGWSLKSDGEQVKIYPGKRGVINARLPQGLHYLELTYIDILPYRISKIVSIALTFVLLCMVVISTLPLKISKK